MKASWKESDQHYQEVFKQRESFFKEKEKYIRNGHEGKWISWCDGKELVLGDDRESVRKDSKKLAEGRIWFLTQIVPVEPVCFVG